MIISVDFASGEEIIIDRESIDSEVFPWQLLVVLSVKQQVRGRESWDTESSCIEYS